MSFGHIKRRPADILFSQYLRKLRGYQCEKCGQRHDPNSKNFGVSHFHGRAHESVRFNMENCDVLCNIPCHRYFEEHKTEYEQWKKEKLGEDRYKALMILANTYQKKDDALVMLWLKRSLGDNSISSMKNKRGKIDRGPECEVHRLKQCSLCHYVKKSRLDKKHKKNVDNRTIRV